MTTTKHKVIKNSYYNLVAMVGTMGSKFIVSILIARSLGPQNMGVYSLVIFIVGTLDIITSMGLQSIAQKYVAEFTGSGDLENRRNIYSYVVTRKIVYSLISALVLVLFSKQIGTFYEDQRITDYILIATVLLLSTGISGILLSIIKGLQEFRAVTYRALVIGPLFILIVYILLINGFGTKSLIIASSVMSSLEIANYYIFIKKHMSLNLKLSFSAPEIVKSKVAKYQWQLAIVVLLDMVVWQKSETFFLGKLASKESVAYYTVAYNIAGWTVSLLPSVFTSVLFPAISEIYGTNNHDAISKIYIHSTRYIMFLAIPLCFCIIGLSDPLIHLLYGSSYAQSITPLRILVISTCFGIVSSTGSSVIYATERQSYILKTGLVIAVINIILDITLISRFGPVGAAIANATSQILGVSVGTTILCYQLSLRFPFGDLAKTIIASTFMLVTMLAVQHFLPGVLGIILSVAISPMIYFYTFSKMNILRSIDRRYIQEVSEILPTPMRSVVGMFFDAQRG